MNKEIFKVTVFRTILDLQKKCSDSTKFPNTRLSVPLVINSILCCGTLVTINESTLIPKHSLKPTLYSDLLSFYLIDPFLCSRILSSVLLHLRSLHLLSLLWAATNFQTFLVFDD